jgi:hypothetical protein
LRFFAIIYRMPAQTQSTFIQPPDLSALVAAYQADVSDLLVTPASYA